jgi:hypothetical protein
MVCIILILICFEFVQFQLVNFSSPFALYNYVLQIVSMHLKFTLMFAYITLQVYKVVDKGYTITLQDQVIH